MHIYGSRYNKKKHGINPCACDWILNARIESDPAFVNYLISSVQFSCSVVSDSLQPHESQHARLPCPSPAPGVHSDSRLSSQWCHPAISSSVVPFFSCLQSLPVSESFPMSQLFTWGGHSTGVSASASFLPKKSQGWSPSEWTGWISLQSKAVISYLTTGFIVFSFFLSCTQSKDHLLEVHGI